MLINVAYIEITRYSASVDILAQILLAVVKFWWNTVALDFGTVLRQSYDEILHESRIDEGEASLSPFATSVPGGGGMGEAEAQEQRHKELLLLRSWIVNFNCLVVPFLVICFSNSNCFNAVFYPVHPIITNYFAPNICVDLDCDLGQDRAFTCAVSP